jgi:hypothetical protein
MTSPKIIFTEAYERALGDVENFLFSTTQDLVVLESFLKEHDKVLNFICENPTAPAVHPATGDQSWPFGDGRYRLFFKFIRNESGYFIFMTHLIDNRQANLQVYPGNKMPTFDEP